jgi:hypothetical protein
MAGGPSSTRISSFRTILRGTRWAHMNWLMLQKLEHREQCIVLEELLGAVRQESERVERLEQPICDAVPEWSLAVARGAFMFQ